MSEIKNLPLRLQVYQRLHTLTLFGYGDSIQEVAAYLIEREIDDLIRAGVFTPKPKSR